MLRITSTAILGIALALPLSAFAESPVDPKAPEASIVAASEDAVPMPAARVQTVQKTERIEKAAPPRNARRGSSQSAADFRFSNPYAFSAQMLPLAVPNVGTFSF